MKKSISAVLAILMTCGLMACGDDAGATPDTGVAADSATPDADVPDADPADTGATPDAGSCTPPAPPYGTMVNRTFAPLDLDSSGNPLVTYCDGSPFTFYNEAFCEARFTVVSIAAGWCAPCRLESRQLTEQITERYRDQGVQVVQVIVADDDYGEPDEAFCDAWVSTYGLTNVEVLDRFGVTQIYFPDNSLPSTLIVDREGTIRFRENGASEGLVSLRGAIESLLAETP